MTGTQEIDERRARILCVAHCEGINDPNLPCKSRKECTVWAVMLPDARAIRLSDEAAGYELCKKVDHKGPIG